MFGVLVIHVSLRLDLIDGPQSHTVFLEKDGKKRISISNLFEKN